MPAISKRKFGIGQDGKSHRIRSYDVGVSSNVEIGQARKKEKRVFPDDLEWCEHCGCWRPMRHADQYRRTNATPSS